MKKQFIPFEKLSKKKQRKLNQERRTLWEGPPTTKVVENKKRKEAKNRCRKATAIL